jgi:hypothetical protein
MPNFSLWRTGFGLGATTAAAVTALPANPTKATEMMVYNPGPAVVRLVVGRSDLVAATATGDARAMPILPGEKGSWHIGDATHYSALVASGTQELECFYGVGD